jgi:hypothetical protein
VVLLTWPQTKLTRFHHVLAPDIGYRVLVTPTKPEKGIKPQLRGAESRTPGEHHASTTVF